MATTEQYLNSLIQDKTNLINAIKEKGVEVDDNATFTQLPDKVSEISGGSYFKWSGANAQLVGSVSKTFDLSDTSFEIGSTISTSTTIIKNSSKDFFVSDTLEIGDKDIVSVQSVVVKPKYNENATNTAKQISNISYNVTTISKNRPNNDMSNRTTISRNSTNISASYINFNNTSGKFTTTTTGPYGIYATSQAPTCQSNTLNSTKISLSTPIFGARSSNSYSNQANMANITECTFEWRAEIYLVDPKTSLYGQIYNMIYSLYDESEVA